MPFVSSELSQQILTSNIMIVDDVKINRVFLEKTLRACGFQNLLSVASAEEVFSRIKSFKPDLILLDILMPDGMDGFDCCETLRQQEEYRDLPILVETSIVEPELRLKAFKKGATDFVSKPIDADELCARVIVHLEKRHSLKTLQLYKNRIETELESARQLQVGILPEQEKIDECERRCGLTFVSAFEPASEIGGDFWGMHPLFPHQTAFWVVDFSGQGMPAALNAFRLHAYLKENVPEAARPGEYLSALNDKLLNLLPRGQFAAMFYGILDTQSHQLFYARAYAPAPIVLHRTTGKAERLEGNAPPLGIGMHLYPTQTFPFALDDMLVLYSDAYLETPNDKDECISEEKLIALIEKNAKASPYQLKEDLLRAFKEHAGNNVRDDLTLVVCAPTTKN